MNRARHSQTMIAWPSLIAGEGWSEDRFGAWLHPEAWVAQGYFPWWVLTQTGDPWAFGLAAPGPALEVLRSSYGAYVPASELPELETRLRAVLGASGWRGERFGLIGPHGLRTAQPELALERSLFRPLGLMSESVQLNVQASDRAWWVGRRAQRKAVDPGLLDACVAGGLTACEQPIMALFREAGEEAGLPVGQTAGAHQLGLVRVFRRLPQGLLIERVWAFGLRVPVSFEPTPTDGEVEEFLQLSTQEIEQAWSSGAFNHEAAVASLSFAGLARAG